MLKLNKKPPQKTKTTIIYYFCNMELLIITIILLALAFAGIAVKIWGKKDGKFAGTCASQSPFLNKEGESCNFCGRTPEEQKNCDTPKA